MCFVLRRAKYSGCKPVKSPKKKIKFKIVTMKMGAGGELVTARCTIKGGVPAGISIDCWAEAGFTDIGQAPSEKP